MSKEQYIDLINNSIIFTLDNKSSVIYEREKSKLIEYVYLYKTCENEQNAEWGLEITSVVINCLKSYKPGETPFLHYFNVAFKKEIDKTKAKETISNNSAGLKFSESEIKLARQLYQYLKKSPDKNIDDIANAIHKYATDIKLTPEELKKAIDIYITSMAEHGDATLKEDSEMTLFDVIESKGNVEDQFINDAEVKIWIDKLEKVFNESRNAIKEVLSIKITSILTVWDEEERYIDYIKQKTFFNTQVFLRVSETKQEIQNQEIGDIAQTSAANITQTWKRFLERVKNEKNIS